MAPQDVKEFESFEVFCIPSEPQVRLKWLHFSELTLNQTEGRFDLSPPDLNHRSVTGILYIAKCLQPKDRILCLGQFMLVKRQSGSQCYSFHTLWCATSQLGKKLQQSINLGVPIGLGKYKQGS